MWQRARGLALALSLALSLALTVAGSASAQTTGAAAAGTAEAAWWFEDSRPSAQAQQAVELLAGAAGHGLDPRDYDSDALQRDLTLLAQAAPAPATTVEGVARTLSASMRLYLNDLHHGRVDPTRTGSRFAPPRREAFDADAVLHAALALHRLPEAVRDAAPPMPLYGHLRDALARYRALAQHPAWRQALPALPRGGRVDAGQAWAGAELMAQRLAALGDLPVPPAAAEGLDGVLVDALKSFQERHGLTVDGTLGAATFRQLQVDPAARARQIELTLERLRWTPLLHGPRMIVINIPEFVLRAYTVEGGRIAVGEAMKVIVGRALDTRTPLFDADLQAIEFSPYWNVPPSIARAETVPQLRRNPALWAREGYEFVGGGGRVDTMLSAAGLDAVLAGRQRIRQRPGPRNALGDIKFVFPNQDHIFLHHTPATSLFARDRRDFSHGCIRVEAPVALAKFVLSDLPAWPEQRIREAMTRGTSNTLRLPAPVRVLIAYGTTLVKDGRTFFYSDIYGLDRRLDDALRQVTIERRQARPPP